MSSCLTEPALLRGYQEFVYWTISRHDYGQTGRDSLYLESICRRFAADIFVSTYYSTPTVTPSFFSGYDMIPEALGFPLTDEAWKEKRRAIMHAAGHAMISRNSAEDLERLYPALPRCRTYVTRAAVAHTFRPASDEETSRFRDARGIGAGLYALMVGERLGYNGYKNGSLVFRALAGLPKDKKLMLICIGGNQAIEPELRELARDLEVRRLSLDDAELQPPTPAHMFCSTPQRMKGLGCPLSRLWPVAHRRSSAGTHPYQKWLATRQSLSMKTTLPR